MSLALAPIVELYRYVLAPIAPFTWFDIGISTLDVVAIIRLCIALRQLREYLHAQHVAKARKQGTTVEVEERSFVRDALTTLTVVYGGEAVAAPLLGVPPSFMLSGVVPVLYTATQALVERLPWVPLPDLTNELPLALVDGITRAYLLCNLIPPSVVGHTSPLVSTSPWTLLLTSLITANGGFFLTGLVSLHQPYSLTLSTPPELLPYGWTTTDIWCAPLMTGLFALLTHAQPFWAELHAVIAGILGAPDATKVAPLDPEVARAVCAVILTSMFTTRAVKNFGGSELPSEKLAKEAEDLKEKKKQ